MTLDAELAKKLCERAQAARAQAYAPYSGFSVGAALLIETHDARQEIVAGVNVENASYGLTVCAERTAVQLAIASGSRRLLAIAVASGSTPAAPPCGMCRQVLVEFADDLPVLLVDGVGSVSETSLAALLPSAFKPALLSQVAVPKKP
ncbi:MAG: cytidine deaminase [Deltaproteobacteria bacterium]|nr:cytidine deaminase [Deltaproteobacteria bacterium]